MICNNLIWMCYVLPLRWNFPAGSIVSTQTGFGSTFRAHLWAVGPPVCESNPPHQVNSGVKPTQMPLENYRIASCPLWSSPLSKNSVLHLWSMYLLASDYVFYLVPAELKTPSLQSSSTKTAFEDGLVPYTHREIQLNQTFDFITSTRFITVYLEQNSMWKSQHNLSCIFKNSRKTKKNCKTTTNKQTKKSLCLVMGLVLWIKYMLDVWNFFVVFIELHINLIM